MPNKLIDGYQRFRNSYYLDNKNSLAKLAAGQAPSVAILACCDARVDPMIIFDANPGELFVIRNVANLVPPMESAGVYHGTSAALEFALTVLKVKDLVILGHADCGGIKALLESPINGNGVNASYIDNWMGLARSVKDQVLAATVNQDLLTQCMLCEREAIILSLGNLMTYPWIAELVNKQQLQLHGWHYDLQHSILSRYDFGLKKFVLLEN